MVHDFKSAILAGTIKKAVHVPHKQWEHLYSLIQPESSIKSMSGITNILVQMALMSKSNHPFAVASHKMINRIHGSCNLTRLRKVVATKSLERIWPKELAKTKEGIINLTRYKFVESEHDGYFVELDKFATDKIQSLTYAVKFKHQTAVIEYDDLIIEHTPSYN